MRPRHVPEIPVVSVLRRGTMMVGRPCEEVLRDVMTDVEVETSSEDLF